MDWTKIIQQQKKRIHQLKYERSREKNTPFYFQSSENRSEEKKISTINIKRK